MRGGELEHSSKEHRLMKQLIYTGRDTWWDDAEWAREEKKQLEKNITNLNNSGNTTTPNDTSITIRGDTLVVDDSSEFVASIPVLNAHLKDKYPGLPTINFTRSYHSIPKPAPTRQPAPTRDTFLLDRNKYTLQNMLTNPLSLIRGDFSEAEKWLKTEFMQRIVKDADVTPKIKVGAPPRHSTDLIGQDFTYADTIINDYNYANSNSEHKAAFKKIFIEIFKKFRAVSIFEKDKSTYMVLFMDDQENKKLIENYDSLNMVKEINEKYELAKKIMEAVKKYSKEELAVAKVKALKETAPSDTAQSETAPMMAAARRRWWPITDAKALPAEAETKEKALPTEAEAEEKDLTPAEWWAREEAFNKAVEKAKEKEARARAEMAKRADIEADRKADAMWADIDAKKKAREAAEAEAAKQPEWVSRNAELPDVESYTDNPETIARLKKEFESKVAEFNPKLANENIANKLITQAHDAHNGGKDIDAYDKMKSGADMMKAIAEFYEVTTDKNITENELLQKRKEAWDRAGSAYYWLKSYAKGDDMKSKITKIKSNVEMWRIRNTEKSNDDGYGNGYTPYGSNGSRGGKSRRKKSRKTKSRKRRTTKRRR